MLSKFESFFYFIILFHKKNRYGINNIHLLNVIPSGFSSIYINITADEPILNKTATIIQYNYTALLTGLNLWCLYRSIDSFFFLGALFQAKIDIEHLHDNQLLNTIVYSSTYSNQNSIVNRTSRLLFVLLGIVLVAIVFALTIFCFQRMYVWIIIRIRIMPTSFHFRHKHNYSKLLKTTTRTCQQTQDELLNPSPSTVPLN